MARSVLGMIADSLRNAMSDSKNYEVRRCAHDKRRKCKGKRRGRKISREVSAVADFMMADQASYPEKEDLQLDEKLLTDDGLTVTFIQEHGERCFLANVCLPRPFDTFARPSRPWCGTLCPSSTPGPCLSRSRYVRACKAPLPTTHLKHIRQVLIITRDCRVQVSALRIILADILEEQEQWRDAAQALISVPLESGHR